MCEIVCGEGGIRTDNVSVKGECDHKWRVTTNGTSDERGNEVEGEGLFVRRDISWVAHTREPRGLKRETESPSKYHRGREEDGSMGENSPYPSLWAITWVVLPRVESQD